MAGGINSLKEVSIKPRPGLNLNILNPSQLRHMTNFTRNGNLSLENRKPYRSKELKKAARKDARMDSDGVYRTTTPVLYHNTRKSSS